MPRCRGLFESKLLRARSVLYHKELVAKLVAKQAGNCITQEKIEEAATVVIKAGGTHFQARAVDSGDRAEITQPRGLAVNAIHPFHVHPA